MLSPSRTGRNFMNKRMYLNILLQRNKTDFTLKRTTVSILIFLTIE